MSVKGTKHSTVSPLVRAAEAHNHKYDYSQSVVTTMTGKIDVGCPTHGMFRVAIKDHLYRKTGCPGCKVDRMLTSRTGTFAKWDTQLFIAKAQEVHGQVYDYTDTVYANAHTPLEIACPTHGLWLTKPTDHIRGNNGLGTGCPQCSSKVSAPEKRIMRVLEKLGVKYTFQFPCGVTSDKGRPMWYDFYIPSINTIVEYDGVQHSRPSTIFPGYEGRVLRDQLKNDWATEAGYTLVRIPHTTKGPGLDTFITNLTVKH